MQRTVIQLQPNSETTGSWLLLGRLTIFGITLHKGDLLQPSNLDGVALSIGLCGSVKALSNLPSS